jgi:hypothetical protein
VRRPHISAMTTPSLTDDDRADLARFLLDRYPLSPRVRQFKALLAKIDPSSASAVTPEAAAASRRAALKRST